MKKMEKLDDLDLFDVTGGNDGFGNENWKNATPCVRIGYLALRSRPNYDEENELASIYNGEMFKVNINKWNGDYIWASYYGTQGWVNSNYVTVLN